jgi:hypothetical protein
MLGREGRRGSQFSECYAGRRGFRSPQPELDYAPLQRRQGHYACGVPPCLRLRGGEPEPVGNTMSAEPKKNKFHQTSRSRARIRLWRLWTLRRVGASPLN